MSVYYKIDKLELALPHLDFDPLVHLISCPGNKKNNMNILVYKIFLVNGHLQMNI